MCADSYHSTPFHRDAHESPSYLHLLPADVKDVVLRYFNYMPEEPPRGERNYGGPILMSPVAFDQLQWEERMKTRGGENYCLFLRRQFVWYD